jgi:hypothetical protein
MAQPTGAIIRLEPTEVQMGEIELRKIDDNTGRVTLQVFNDGKAPLILQKVSGCCGTDIKEYTKAPILPEKSGTIEVYFRVEPKLQAISRTVTILSNATNAKEVQVHIRGLVVKNKEQGRVAF